WLPSPRQPGGTARPAGTLSARELQVAKLITEGLSNPEIAVRLDIAKRTVDAHVRNILAKGGLASRTQVAAWVAESDYQSAT
ncbi:response regulator transcription factor, partial [Streptosporangium algeriense]